MFQPPSLTVGRQVIARAADRLQPATPVKLALVAPNGAVRTRLPGATSSDQRNLLSVALQGHADEFRWPFIRKNGTWLMRAFLLLQY
ncbi:hypothetical protein AB0D78_36435 [Streptomyces avermitilis]|uniref:hypothetical protein n=1 Tax=Streptomyces avermitilis TaxID=33903 RepID=UPI0033C88B5F